MVGSNGSCAHGITRLSFPFREAVKKSVWWTRRDEAARGLGFMN